MILVICGQKQNASRKQNMSRKRSRVCPVVSFSLADLVSGREIRGQKRFISKNEAQQGCVRAENQERIKDDFGQRKCIPSFIVSGASCGRRREKEAAEDSQKLLIFHAEVMLRELAHKFDQEPIGPALRVSEQGRHDVAVAEVEDRLRSVAREPSQVVEESNLDAVPAMRVPLLRRRQTGLQDSSEILNIHRRLLPLLVT
jgi:hypothetical protein